MKREDLFRAVGEVREEQIQEAAEVKRLVRLTKPWRQMAAAAACLALIVSVCAAGNWMGKEIEWRYIIGSFNPLDTSRESAGGGGDSGGTFTAGGLDGNNYSSDGTTKPSPNLSWGVEIAELQWEGTVEIPETGAEASPSSGLLRLGDETAEDLLGGAEVIFRGTVQNLRYAQIESHDYRAFYTIASVEVTDSIRGNLTEGEIYSILYTGFPGRMPAISENLGYLKIGSDAIFMPLWTNPEAGWKTEDGFFAYIDLADMYFDEGLRLLFLDTGENLMFERSVYPNIAGAETLDDVAAYLRAALGETAQSGVIVDEEEKPGAYFFVEGTQPAAVPAEPQAEPSRTEEAGPRSNGPAGARELPGGALIAGE